MLNGFGTIVNSLGKRVKPYLPQICGTILWRLNNKSAKVRQQAADLISKIAVVMKTCQEEKLMGHLGVVLYEYLGEEYPEVLGSILGALKAIVNVSTCWKTTIFMSKFDTCQLGRHLLFLVSLVTCNLEARVSGAAKPSLPAFLLPTLACSQTQPSSIPASTTVAFCIHNS